LDFVSRRGWNLLIAAVCVLGIFWIDATRLPPGAGLAEAGAGARAGLRAPDFSLERLDGGQVTLSELRGRAVVVNLWASWCLPCRAEMPALEAAYQRYRGQGVEFVAVNATSQDREADARALVSELGLTFPVGWDRSGAVAEAYRLRGLPSTFFIDRNGMVREVVVGGPMNPALIQSRIEELLR
jgi:cytochrome c biogenesis protein CcmG, thiol:disulfide interchange protein DsbE